MIPGHMVSKLAKEHGVDAQSRTFTPWSHVVSIMFAYLSHAFGLNDVCDSLQMNSSALATIRSAVPPSRNNLSHANKIRNADMAEALYWGMMKHLMHIVPGFAKGKVRRGYLRRFNKMIHALDSTTIQLVANCIDWAKHRRRKAAAKCHLRLDLQSFLPQCAIIDTAKHHDSTKAMELCAGLEPGGIAVFDKAYTKFKHLFELTKRGVWWVGRAKGNMQYNVIRTLETTARKRILCDEVIEMALDKSKETYPCELSRVVALVEINEPDVEMVFMTNHLEWSAWTVSELYRCRWDIEVFFKEIKQTLQLSGFPSHSANAVRWQVWMGLLVTCPCVALRACTNGSTALNGCFPWCARRFGGDGISIRCSNPMGQPNHPGACAPRRNRRICRGSVECCGTAICLKRGTLINLQQKIGIDYMKRTSKTLIKTGVYNRLSPAMG